MPDELLEEKVSVLIGKKIRVYKTGEMLTDDYIENRVNIEVSQEGLIEKIWYG